MLAAPLPDTAESHESPPAHLPVHCRLFTPDPFPAPSRAFPEAQLVCWVDEARTVIGGRGERVGRADGRRRGVWGWGRW